MPYELPPDPSTERRTRLTRWVSFAFAVVLVALVAYFAYVGYEGSRQLTDPPTPTADCRTPATMGWDYEAINYDIATDAELATEADPTECARQGAPAGDAVTVGNIGLAGWYIPAGNGAAPTAPTVVIAHGWGSNKSNMLDRAAILHDDYNLLLFDLRNHGQSSEAPTTQGVREADDLRAMIDWLEATKAPARSRSWRLDGRRNRPRRSRSRRAGRRGHHRIDPRLSGECRAGAPGGSGYPLALPASWATLLGSLISTGEDVSSADPVQAVDRLDERPVLHHLGWRRMTRSARTMRRAPCRGRPRPARRPSSTSARRRPMRSRTRRARRTMPAGC